MAPIYDFDHALDSTSSNDIIIQNLLEMNPANELLTEAERICRGIIDHTTIEIFRNRTISIYHALFSFRHT